MGNVVTSGGTDWLCLGEVCVWRNRSGTRKGLPPGTPAEVLLELHRYASDGDLRLEQVFAYLFCQIPGKVVAEVRCALDADLVFRPGGVHVDLRYLVFDSIEEMQRARVLERIREECAPPPAERHGFLVMSDVDDTLLPGADPLGVCGRDRSWTTNGELYPGVCRLMCELRGDLGSLRDYHTVLTARPPKLAQGLTHKLARLASNGERPRMAILPGADGFEMIANTFNILRGRFSNLGVTKLERFKEYVALFPDYAGRFVFIGDDGQADMVAGIEMLEFLRVMSTGEGPAKGAEHGDGRETGEGGDESDVYQFSVVGKGEPLVAFVAIHAVSSGDGIFRVSAGERAARLADVRREHPPHPEHAALAAGAGAAAGERHRFFYYVDCVDLAEQLAAAGWIGPQQLVSVKRAHARDCARDPEDAAQAHDLMALKSSIKTWRDEASELDCHERAALARAEAALTSLEKAESGAAAPTVQPT